MAATWCCTTSAKFTVGAYFGSLLLFPFIVLLHGGISRCTVSIASSFSFMRLSLLRLLAAFWASAVVSLTRAIATYRFATPQTAAAATPIISMTAIVTTIIAVITAICSLLRDDSLYPLNSTVDTLGKS